MEKNIGGTEVLELNNSDVYVINDNMEIVYLRGIKTGGKTYYNEEDDEINDIIDNMSKKTIKAVVQGEGSVEGATEEGTRYEIGEKVTLKAIPGVRKINGEDYTYLFKGWYLNGEIQGKDITLEITVTNDATYVAIFELEPTLIYYADGTIEATSESTLTGYSGNTDIVKVEIGTTCTKIGLNAFKGCTGITGTLTIPDNIIFNTAGDDAWGHGGFAFSNTGIEQLVIGNNVNIPMRTFINCTELKSITIGDNVILRAGHTSTNQGGFYGCTSLEKVIMGNNIKIVSTSERYSYLFYNCSNLKEVTVKSLSQVDGGAFYGVGDALKGDIVINEGVTTISNFAFYGCTNSANIKIPKTVTTIGTSAFEDCTGITGQIDLTNVTTIGASAFKGCTGITGTLTIPDGVKFGSNAYAQNTGSFAGCTGITELIIGSGTEENPMDIPMQTFIKCTALESITMGDDVILRAGHTSTNQGGFYGCTSLEKVTMGNNIQIINGGNSANYSHLFKNCTKISEITVKSLSGVGLGAFYGEGAALQGDIVINEGVNAIGASAFSGCSDITSVTIPSTIKSIGNYAFSGCTGLTIINVCMSEADFNNVTKGTAWNEGVSVIYNYIPET